MRLQLHELAYNLGNFLRTLATPGPIKDWSLTSLKEKLIKIGAKVVSHGRYVAFQEVAIPRQIFQEFLGMVVEIDLLLPSVNASEEPLRGRRCARVLRLSAGHEDIPTCIRPPARQSAESFAAERT